ncbi:MAG: hypothetical protein U5L76_04720 [Patescibacteria group bacterium]|nr:hypothetical protein [Patescibacteria group bacterium]
MTSQAVKRKKEVCPKHGIPLEIRLKKEGLIPSCGEPPYELVCPLCGQKD